MLEAPAIMEVLKKDLIQYCTSRQSSECGRCTLQEHEMQKWIKTH